MIEHIGSVKYECNVDNHCLPMYQTTFRSIVSIFVYMFF